MGRSLELGVRGRGTIMPGALGGLRLLWAVPGREPCCPGGPWGRGFTGSLDRQVRGATPCWLRSMRMQRAWGRC